MTEHLDQNINESVDFSSGQVAVILRRMEEFLGIPLSFRSSTGDTVVKTDYFFGPCSIIRGTCSGRTRCRKVYAQIEEKLLRRKVPTVTFCYAGFLIFAVPLNFRGEMIGTLIGSQILPLEFRQAGEIETQFAPIARGLGIRDLPFFVRSFHLVRHLDPDFERVSFLLFLEKLGEHFIEMAFSKKIWARFYREMTADFPLLEKVKLRK